ncbi:hypothetical protein FE840_018585 (plasmid) [Peteryoungia desertarenae]|uniref:Uncharacterized protein n=1 Tax=Peteryoungia desertarenae TaxID=1813451 RepID=A0ABX6QTP5_9HYPH|nr:hypothetical protein [Peteryoungia desertarenae]QLF71656.1 hypothetical protein FE840_018585 [Peteryoungia desertarenae]
MNVRLIPMTGSKRLVSLAVVALLVSSCQSGDFLKTDGSASAQPAHSANSVGLYNQTLGSGPTKVGFLGVRRADASARQADHEYRDGAALAVNAIGSNIVQLTMLEAMENPKEIEAATKSLADKGARMIITSARDGELELVRSAIGDRPVTVLAFTSNQARKPDGVYAFLSSPTDSLLESATFAMAEGSGHAVIVASTDAGKAHGEALSKNLKGFGAKVEPVIDVSSGSLSSKAQASWKRADMVIVMPDVKNPGAFLKRADSTTPPRPGRRIVASTALTGADLSDPKLTGAIVCRYDQNVSDRIGQRYLASYGMPASQHAGYGFDAMAMAIGLANNYGDEAFVPERIMQPQGFSGAMGVFRLEEGGTVRRNCDIFKVAKGSYVFFQRAPTML